MRTIWCFVASSAFFLLTSFSAAQANILITVDRSTQRMSVSVDGKPRWNWPVSTGKRGYQTPTGSYTAFRMEEDHFSKEWDNAPMPHSIFFSPRGHAIHGTLESGRLGTAVSHGCVRLSKPNAAQLFALVEEKGLGSTKVVITGEQPPALPPSVARRQSMSPDEAEVAASSSASRYGQPRGYYYQQPAYADDYYAARRPSYAYPPAYGYPSGGYRPYYPSDLYRY